MSRLADLDEILWPAAELGDLLTALAQRTGGGDVAASDLGPAPARRQLADRWIEAAGETLGVEAEPTSVRYPQLDGLLRRSAPLLARYRAGSEDLFVGLLAARRNDVWVARRGGGSAKVSREALRDLLRERAETPEMQEEIEALLERIGTVEHRRPDVRHALLQQRLRSALLGGFWIIRPLQRLPFRRLLSALGLRGRLAGLVALHLVQYVTWVLSWYAIGRGALMGRVDRTWILAWILMLVTLVPFRTLVAWMQGTIAVRAGAALKQRLLAGALRLRPEEIRHQGAGQLLGRVFESEAFESLAIGGGFMLLLGGVEVLVAAVVLTLGSEGWLLAAALLAWLALVVSIGRGYWRRRMRWTAARLDLTHQLTESLIGYRTRLAQLDPDAWHDSEDVELARYIGDSVDLDRTATRLQVLIPRGWLVLALVALLPLFVAGSPTVGRMAISFGGVLLAYRALRQIAAGMGQLLGASIAWSQVRELFAAAGREQVPTPASMVASAAATRAADLPVLEVRELSYVYPDRVEPALQKCDLTVRRGDRIRVEGPSGSGKSTLLALLAAQRSPRSGLILLDGLDRSATGTERWRRSVVLAPQMHENHIFSEPLAFNLLMGKCWPAGDEDLRAAASLCEQLGLGPLLRRMPAGLFQIVGDTGWQLSQGERARVFLARALLQEASVHLSDESDASLDAETAVAVARAATKHSPTLVRVSHQ